MAGTSPAMTNETHCLSAVMPGFMPGIHVLTALQTPKTRMAATSPAMTISVPWVKLDFNVTA